MKNSLDGFIKQQIEKGDTLANLGQLRASTLKNRKKQTKISGGPLKQTNIHSPRRRVQNGAEGISSVQSLNCVLLLASPWSTTCQASPSITNAQSLPKPMSIKSVTPSNHVILCHPLLLLPSIFPSIRVFSNESALRIR